MSLLPSVGPTLILAVVLIFGRGTMVVNLSSDLVTSSNVVFAINDANWQ